MFNKALFRRQRAALNDDPQVKSYGRGLIHSLLIFGVTPCCLSARKSGAANCSPGA